MRPAFYNEEIAGGVGVGLKYEPFFHHNFFRLSDALIHESQKQKCQSQKFFHESKVQGENQNDLRIIAKYGL